MKMIALISIAFALTACQPQYINQAAQQQHFVCKSLIEGFLKTQRLGNYQLDHLVPTLHQTATVRDYLYRTSDDQTVKINMPVQNNLEFKCQQTSAQHFEIHLVTPQQENTKVLLSLDIPPKKMLDTLTAFKVEKQ